MVFERIREIIVEQLDINEEKVTLAASVKDDFQADSLDLFEIVMAVEDAFSIEIDENAIMEIKTVGELVTLVEGMVK